MCHLDRMSVPQLVRRKSTPDARPGSRVMQLLARGRGLPAPAGGRPVDHAQQRPERELTSELKPWVELLPGQAVHPDLASSGAFPAPDEPGPAGSVQVALWRASAS